MLPFFGIFELGSLLHRVAQSSKMLIIGRAVAVIGGPGLVNGGLTILASTVPMNRRLGRSQVCCHITVINGLTSCLWTALTGISIDCNG
jgi:hypothetical protein